MKSDHPDNLMLPLTETLVYVIKGMSPAPGDIILTGAPSGGGHVRDPNPVWMGAGDICEVEVEGISGLHRRLLRRQDWQTF
jgi:2-keto-4-pentenoate hydratase/2-oxohepta-3-ene-1,7-dioic acid hydratase in catechol pathway